jgi:GTP-binding protein HflX
MGRQVGLFVDRRGQVENVFVGDASKIYLPDFGRLRAGRGRFRGLRLIHTHLKGEPLSRDDITDLTLLRLDMVVAVSRADEQGPVKVSLAHLMPDGTDEKVRKMGPMSLHRLELSFLDTINALEQEFAKTADERLEAGKKPGAVLVHVSNLPTRQAEGRIQEMQDLADTAGLVVLDVIRQRRRRPDPKYVVGRGKIQDTVLRAMQVGADNLLFDPDLRPSQARAITEMTDLKVLDRTMLILDIFAQRAKSRAGKVQVELAQLKYALPRLVAKNTMMSRLTGGIGGRGPGETKLEINRRRARQRIRELEKKIDQISRQRTLRRKRRNQHGVPVVALVGYTNAGKSTLLNTLTNSQVLTENRLFATLDPSSRRLRFPKDREIVLTDTVGFIHELPNDLMRAFRATLEELYDADLIVHIVDAADERFAEKQEDVERILAQMELAEVDRVTVYNKADKLDGSDLSRVHEKRRHLLVSALDPDSTRPLLEEVEQRVL